MPERYQRSVNCLAPAHECEEELIRRKVGLPNDHEVSGDMWPAIHYGDKDSRPVVLNCNIIGQWRIIIHSQPRFRGG